MWHRRSHTLTAEIKLHLAFNNPISICKCIYNMWVHHLRVYTKCDMYFIIHVNIFVCDKQLHGLRGVKFSSSVHRHVHGCNICNMLHIHLHYRNMHAHPSRFINFVCAPNMVWLLCNICK